jgi:hypothetical protein
MFKRVMGGVLLLLVVLTVAGCSSKAAAVGSTQINAAVDGEKVSLSASEVAATTNARFAVKTPAGQETFMAYQLGKDLHVRADICPPCRSVSFTLKGDILSCDRCGTTFNAVSGKGVSGACVNYPKAAVPYQVTDGKVVMQISDLDTAYQNTVAPGLP